MPHYKLTYFKLTGRGELPRLILKAADVAFEDERLGNDEWPSRKADMPFGQMPVFEEDGKQICQSVAIARYLAKKFGLAGKTDWEQAQVDMIVDCLEDQIKPMPGIWKEDRLEKQAAMKKVYVEETMPTSLGNFQKLLVANGGGDGFFVGDGLTFADLAFYHYLSYTEYMGMTAEVFLVNFPKLMAHRERVASLPRIAQWLKDRPADDFPGLTNKQDDTDK